MLYVVEKKDPLPDVDCEDHVSRGLTGGSTTVVLHSDIFFAAHEERYLGRTAGEIRPEHKRVAIR